MLRVFGHYLPAIAVVSILGDLVTLTASVLLASQSAGWIGTGPLWPKALAVCGITVFSIYVTDLYRTDSRLNRRELVARLVVALLASALVMAALGFAVPALRFSRSAFVQIFSAFAIGLVPWRIVLHRICLNGRLHARVLVLGLSRAAGRLVELRTTGSQPFVILGFLDDAPDAHDKLPAGTELLGKPRDLLNLVDELRPDLIVVALSDMRGALPTSDLLECRLRGIRVEEWPTFFEKQTGRVLVTDLRPSWLIFSDGFVSIQITQTLKKVLDLTLALSLLVLTLPLMLLVAVSIRLDSKGPILFRQPRVGHNSRIFMINKFRSMRDNAERESGAVWATAGDPRVTRVGRIIRRTRLDELPQLFNVLLGEMSFVGPRPERPEFVRTLHRQIPFYSGRLAVKPGITGWAQVRHHYAASVEDAMEKLQYDLYYIKNLSPFLDILILLSTIQVVLFARGAR